MRFDVHARRAVPGDLVDVQITMSRRRRLDGWVRELVEPSVLRVEPRCAHFASEGARPGCGGCSLQLLTLETQRTLKAERLRRLLAARGLDPSLVEEPVGIGDGWYYRNKMDFSFAGGPDDLTLGMHPGGFKYEVLDHRECLLMSAVVSELIGAVTAWARTTRVPAFRADEGWWRELVVREGKHTGERMIELVTSHLEPDAMSGAQLASKFADWIAVELGDAVTSLYWTQIRAVRGERTQRVEHHLAGRPTLREELHVAGQTLGFEIAPRAFFQTNTAGAELLYALVAEYAAPTGHETVLDLYSGTGTIALCLARAAAHVVAVELVEAAVENARQNAALNGIDNIELIAGDVGEVLAARELAADVVVVDPPRAGLLPAAHAALERLDAQRLVYVSCNPSALARDLASLNQRWEIDGVRPIDMFPQTAHIETVVSLRQR